MGGLDVANPDFDQSLALRRALAFSASDLAANTTVFLTIKVQYTLARVPSLSSLPRVYTFSGAGLGLVYDDAGEVAGEYTAATSASATGILER